MGSEYLKPKPKIYSRSDIRSIINNEEGLKDLIQSPYKYVQNR